MCLWSSLLCSTATVCTIVTVVTMDMRCFVHIHSPRHTTTKEESTHIGNQCNKTHIHSRCQGKWAGLRHARLAQVHTHSSYALGLLPRPQLPLIAHCVVNSVKKRKNTLHPPSILSSFGGSGELTQSGHSVKICVSGCMRCGGN